MGKISLNDVSVSNANSSNQVGFFNLKNDGEEAVVRFMVDSVDDMEILTTHDIKLDGRFRQISCLRDPREPMENCPLCARGENVKQVVFIKMIQYENTENGIQAKPVVWQRNANTYAFRIKGYLDNYGPLSNILCKIIRHGKSGDVKTTYDIIPNLNPAQFPQENYPADKSAFEDYSALGTVVLDKSKEDINTFIASGSFPMEQNVPPQNVPPAMNAVPTDDDLPFGQPYNNVGNNVPSMNGMGKPNRYY